MTFARAIAAFLTLAVSVVPAPSWGGNPAAATAETMPPPGVCSRDFGKQPEGIWLGQLIHGLCQRGDGDALLSAYLLTLPSFGMEGEPDYRLLARAYDHDKRSNALLWTVALAEDCQPIGTACLGFARDADAARKLVRADPDNAMAWLALAYNDARTASVDGANAAMIRAARAPRVHDYTFDVLKLAAAASGELPIPEAARSNGHGVFFPPEVVRWTLIQTVPALSQRLGEWVKEGCGAADLGVSSAERSAQCAAVKVQLQRGDSALTLSEDPAASATLQADKKQRPVGMSNGDGSADVAYAQALIGAIGESSSEKDVYTRLAARLRTAQGRP